MCRQLCDGELREQIRRQDGGGERWGRRLAHDLSGAGMKAEPETEILRNFVYYDNIQR